MNRQRAYRPYVLALALIAAAACAHPSLKTTTVVTLQTTLAATGSAQDFEVAAYNAKLPGLTDQAHLAISQAFVKIFDVQGKAAVAVDNWRAGDPVPADLTTYVQDITDALATAKQAAPGLTSIVDKIQFALDEAVKVLTIIKGGK